MTFLSATTENPLPPIKAGKELQQRRSSATKLKLKYRPEDDISIHSSVPTQSHAAEDIIPRLAANTLGQIDYPRASIEDLPLEIQEEIIDYTHGVLGSASCTKWRSGYGLRNWSTLMRHPRRKHLSDLALVSRTWRILIQQRLYRHGKSGQ